MTPDGQANDYSRKIYAITVGETFKMSEWGESLHVGRKTKSKGQNALK
jgi:hypothetical protein